MRPPSLVSILFMTVVFSFLSAAFIHLGWEVGSAAMSLIGGAK